MTALSRSPRIFEWSMLLVAAGWFALFLAWPDTTTPKVLPIMPTATVFTYVRHAEMQEDPTLVALPRFREEFQKVDPIDTTASAPRPGIESDAGTLAQRRAGDDRNKAVRGLLDQVQRTTRGYRPQARPIGPTPARHAADEPAVAMRADGGLAKREVITTAWPLETFSTENAWSARAFVEVDPDGTVSRVMLESGTSDPALNAAIVGALHRCRTAPGSEQAWGRIYLDFDPQRLRNQQVPDKDSPRTEP